MLKIKSLGRFLLLGAALFSACRYPKYAGYKSPQGDYHCLVPFSWNVMTESDGAHFSNANFVGPFEPDFFLGVPSLSVRWYGYYMPHKLPDGTLEMYGSVDDFIAQTLDAVYPKRKMKVAVEAIDVAGRKGKFFEVLSPAPIPKNSRHWGVSEDVETKAPVVLRQHAYVVLGMDGGFYVLVYPATKDGFPKYEKEFNQLVHSFTPLLNGPKGSPVAAASVVAK